MRISRELRPPRRACASGGAARFAADILARRGPAPGDESYPEVWLAFRKSAEREEAQTAADQHLTQVTLRLALQINEYLSAPVRAERTEMELSTLRESLRTCLTALETRDRETCREVRLLLRESAPRPGEREHRTEEQHRETQQLRERLTRRLIRLERENAALSAAAHGTESREIRSIERTRQEDKTVRLLRERTEHTEHLKSETETARILRERVEFQNRLMARVETEQIPGEGFTEKSGHGNAASAEAAGRPTPPAVQTQRGTSPRRRPGRIASAAAGREISLLRRRMAERSPGEALAVHKERFLLLLERADREEKETVWRTVEEELRLTGRIRQQLREEYHLEPGEKLTRLVRESTHREYTELLQVLERKLTRTEERETRTASPARPGPSEAEAPGERSETETARQLRTAAPLLVQLEASLRSGRVQRKALLLQAEEAPEPVRSAFLALARQSGVFSPQRMPRGEETVLRITEQEELTRLVRESRYSQLRELLTWAAEHHETRTVQSESSRPDQVPMPRENRQTAVREELREDLRRTGETSREELTRLLREAPPEQRSTLLTGLLEAAGEAPTPLTSYDAIVEERVITLLERSPDPAALLEKARSSRAMAAAEHRREQERGVERRIETFFRQKGQDGAQAVSRLTEGLNREERRYLLQILRETGAVRELPVTEAVPTETQQELERVLSFRTREEYEHVREQLSRYWSTRPAEAGPLLPELVRWAGERQRGERQSLLRAVTRLLEDRPAAWSGVLLPLTLEDRKAPAGEQLAYRTEPSAVSAEILNRIERGGGEQLTRLIRLLEEDTVPKGLLERALPALREALPVRGGAGERMIGSDRSAKNDFLSPALREPVLSAPGEPVLHREAGGSPASWPGGQIEIVRSQRDQSTAAEKAGRSLEHRRGWDTLSALSLNPSGTQRFPALTVPLGAPPALLSVAGQPGPAAEKRPVGSTADGSPLPGHVETGASPLILQNRGGERGENSSLIGETRAHGRAPASEQMRSRTGQKTEQAHTARLYTDPEPLPLRTGEKTETVHMAQTMQPSAVQPQETERTGLRRSLLPGRPAPEERGADLVYQQTGGAAAEDVPKAALLRTEPLTAAREIGTVAHLPTGERIGKRQIGRLRLRRDSRATKQSPLTHGQSSPQMWETDRGGAELELRREQSAQAARIEAAKAVERSAELAVQRQSPELHLLKKQSQEQERALAQQKNDLNGLRQQLARQETLVRRAMERADAADPAQVQKFTKAVMKELEGQLRLERQRRGLT